MPELPEVETIRRQLHQAIIGKTIANVQVLRSKSFQGQPTQLIGQTIQQVDRKAKVIHFHFEKKSYPQLLIHLRMTGQLIYQSNTNGRIVGGHPTPDWVNDLPSSHTRIITTFTDNSTLFFNDQRVFGWFKVINSQADITKELKNFVGIEPLRPEFTLAEFIQRLHSTSQPIKVAILDQKKIAGMGNIYANDALWAAQVHPTKPANSLTPQEYKSLHQSMEKVIALGIKYGGATESDYRHLDGLGGSYQNYFLTYKQDKKPCQRCGTIIAKIKVGGRGTYYCPKCQRLD